MKQPGQPPLILASTSPYRRELLARLRVSFECEAPGVDEGLVQRAGGTPIEIAEKLALLKAKAVAARHPGAIVIGGDQVAALGGTILGKPGSAERASEQLLLLQGQTHELVTAIVVIDQAGLVRTYTEVARLTMRPLGREEINRYVAADNPIDCAGSYKLESLGIALFDQIAAVDHTAIVGLPLLATARLLRECGLQVP